MRVDQAFRKAGFEIVGATKGDNNIVFDVRIPLQDKVPTRWKLLMEDILAAAEVVASKVPPKWELDISKRFYAKNGVVRYLWRITMRGNLAVCQQALVAATLNALRHGNEVKEVALVGQVNLRPDPANGRYMGAYHRNGPDDDPAARAIAGAFVTGGA